MFTKLIHSLANLFKKSEPITKRNYSNEVDWLLSLDEFENRTY
jgi:hypothetical protein